MSDESGGFVVLRGPDGMFWSGEAWVDDEKQALFYPGAPEDGVVRANAECARQRALGHRCYTLVRSIERRRYLAGLARKKES